MLNIACNFVARESYVRLEKGELFLKGGRDPGVGYGKSGHNIFDDYRYAPH